MWNYTLQYVTIIIIIRNVIIPKSMRNVMSNSDSWEVLLTGTASLCSPFIPGKSWANPSVNSRLTIKWKPSMKDTSSITTKRRLPSPM